jgi:hypothetical protein
MSFTLGGGRTKKREKFGTGPIFAINCRGRARGFSGLKPHLLPVAVSRHPVIADFFFALHLIVRSLGVRGRSGIVRGRPTFGVFFTATSTTAGGCLVLSLLGSCVTICGSTARIAVFGAATSTTGAGLPGFFGGVFSRSSMRCIASSDISSTPFEFRQQFRQQSATFVNTCQRLSSTVSSTAFITAQPPNQPAAVGIIDFT